MSDKSDAWLDGWLAHRDHLGSNANPYDPVYAARSHAQWSAGWGDRFNRAKHGGDENEYDNSLYDY